MKNLIHLFFLLPLFSISQTINVAQAASDGGFAYYVTQDFGTAPDVSLDVSKSILKIFENGIELKPAHALHADIRTLGAGRFSHWSNGTIVGLYFSASDNSNPATNGKTYTFFVPEEKQIKTTKVRVVGVLKPATVKYIIRNKLYHPNPFIQAYEYYNDKKAKIDVEAYWIDEIMQWVYVGTFVL